MRIQRFRFMKSSIMAILSAMFVFSLLGASIASANESTAVQGMSSNEPSSASLLSSNTSTAAYEAESTLNTLTGNAEAVNCGFCSGGKKVGNLYGGATLQFNEVNVDEAGVYTMTVHYISGDSRSASISVNGAEKENLSFPKTADWDTLGQYDIQIYLQQGSNTILFDDDGSYSPDFDKIELSFDSDGNGGSGSDGSIGDLGQSIQVTQYNSITLTEYTNGIKVANPSYELLYNTNSGLAQYNWNGKTVAKGIYSTVQLAQTLASKDYGHHSFNSNEVVPFQDATGEGIRITIHNEEQGRPTLQQIYYVYNNAPYLLTETVVQQSVPLTTNNIAPIVIDAKGGLHIGTDGDHRVLVAPFDNDSWSRYQSKTINTNLNNDNYVSSELTAVFDNSSRNGLVIGSVTHDTWKTGIYWSGSENKLNKLRVFGGFTSQTSTRDTIEHGYVTGTQIASPKIFVGFYDDYRDGLEGFGEMNAAISPPLVFGPGIPQGVPVGWNSWGAHESALSYDKAAAASNYFKEKLQNQSFHNNGDLYINLDSYWDNMTDQQLSELVTLIHNNGQKAGIYYSPFVYWGDNLDQVVEGTNGQYTYGDIVLRDQNNNPLPTLDGAYPVDPTHPAAKQRITYYMNRFKDKGFEYIKIDFLTHGALEGQHFDPQVQTGIQAYNQGMAYLNDALDDSMFISASIAPLFPSQYAHSRRISCDIDGSIGSTEYQLNNLTYGWWQNGTIYHYTDPDYMTLAKGGSFEGAQSRVNAAAISGTVYLNSDDVSSQTARQYMEALLTKPQINALALKGKAFRPVEGNTGINAANMFVLSDNGTHYLAVFNYTQNNVEQPIDLTRAGIENNTVSSYKVTDMWTEQLDIRPASFTISLKGAESKLYKIEPNN
ncbi:carbohydrate-binding protein [Paenibacillus fonticola]|uniref:carbohydrate-binding protein n=1 Tax=Paenibacillus fonticola TaxID=379896 RepID=UPI0004774F8A|nr:carbohydrate-binding protein [Paenibacillus fonticola]